MGTPEQFSERKILPWLRNKTKEIGRDYLDQLIKLRLERLLKRLGIEGTQQNRHQAVRNIFNEYLHKPLSRQDGYRYERESSEDNRYGLEQIYKGDKVMGYRTIDFHPDPGMHATELFVTIETNAGFNDVGLRLFEFPEINGEHEPPFLDGGFYTSPRSIRYFASDDPKRSRDKELE